MELKLKTIAKFLVPAICMGVAVFGCRSARVNATDEALSTPPAPPPDTPPSAAEIAQETFFKSLHSHVNVMRFSSDSKKMITAGAITREGRGIDKKLRVWDVREARDIWRLPTAPAVPEYTEIMPDFKTIFTWGNDGYNQIDIHSFHFGDKIEVRNGNKTYIGLSPNEKLFAVGATRHVYFIDAKTLKTIRVYEHGGQGTNVFWGPQSKTLVMEAWGGKPQAIDVATAKQIHYPRWFYRVRGSDAFAFSPDGNFIAKAKDHTVEIWETPTATSAGKKLNTFTTKIDLVRVMQFSPDGKTLAVGGSSKTETPVQFITLSQMRK